MPEIKHHCPSAAVLLTGLKIDLRHDQDVIEKVGATITAEEGQTLAKAIGARAYVECSSLTQEGLKNVFDEAVRARLNKSLLKRRVGLVDLVDYSVVGIIIIHRQKQRQRRAIFQKTCTAKITTTN